MTNPSAPTRGERPPRRLTPPRWSLTLYLGLMAVVAGLLVVRQWAGVPAAVLTGFALVAVTLHLAGTRIGTTLRGPRPVPDAPPNGFLPHVSHPRPSPGCLAPPRSASPSPLTVGKRAGARERTVVWIAVVLGAAAAGSLGWGLLSHLSERSLHPMAAAAGSAAWAVLGALAAFGLARLGAVVWAARSGRDSHAP